MLELQQVSCGYGGKPVLKQIRLSVQKGEKLCILGPNGSGKSTLLKAVAGLLPYEGSILLEGVPLRDKSRKEMARSIALLQQISQVYFPYSVLETVLLGRYSQQSGGLFSDTTKADREFALHCLESVAMQDMRHRSILDLSGGELQRVFLAKVFAQDPQVILLDEPTNHLDLKHQLALMDYLDRWAEADDRTVLAVLHDINLALSFGDRILLLSEGETVALGTRAEILAQNPFGEAYGLDVKAYMRQAYAQWNG